MSVGDEWIALRTACQNLDIVWFVQRARHGGTDGIECLYCSREEHLAESGEDYWHAEDCPWVAYKRALADVQP